MDINFANMFIYIYNHILNIQKLNFIKKINHKKLAYILMSKIPKKNLLLNVIIYIHTLKK